MNPNKAAVPKTAIPMKNRNSEVLKESIPGTHLMSVDMVQNMTHERTISTTPLVMLFCFMVTLKQ